MYSGIDADVRRMFFALDGLTLKLVFNRYEKEHGSGKRKYAERTFEEWRSGRVQMGGEISDRLVRIVPVFLTFDQKYELIEKLWARFRQKTTLNVTISPAGGLDAAIDAVMGAIEAVGEQEIPTAVAERLEWLAADDGVAAQALLGQITKRECEIAVQTLETELRQLLAIAQMHKDKSVWGTRTVNLPGATVYIHISQTVPLAARSPAMSNGQVPPEGEKSGQLSGPQGNQPTRDLAPIQNPNDLLGEALRRMSPQKQEEIVGKATDEALRLQVKQKEGKIDHEMASSKVDSAAEAANRFVNAGTEFEVKAEHRSEHGSVQVTVRSKRQSLSQRVGGCFVATACYGDESHPAVVVLREFRDTYLRVRPSGRAFVAWYYRNSPPYAQMIEDRAVLRLTARLLLVPLVAFARLAIWLDYQQPGQRDDQIPR
ncbi:MAG: CFI-box-CTERM domain-containing protein [Phycisphaerales bacterium]